MLPKSALLVAAILAIPLWLQAGPKKDDEAQAKAKQQLVARQAAAKAAEHQRDAARDLSEKTAIAQQAAVHAKNNAEAQDALKKQAGKQHDSEQVTEPQSALLSTEVQTDSD
jgi:hypothetical protein